MLASVASTYGHMMTSVFSAPIVGKVWFASAAGFFALLQVTTAARIFGKLKRFIPWKIAGAPVNVIHRWSGRIAFVCTLPVAFHCIFILGFQTSSPRVLAHSIVGSFVYGVICLKLLMVHSRRYPGWALPLAGGTLFAVLVTLWSTSAAWYFTNVRFGF